MALVVAIAGSASASLPAAELQLRGRAGVQEIVLSVSDLEASGRLWRGVAGYRTKWQGAESNALARLWELPPQAQVRSQLLGLPQHDGGLLRLSQIRGAPQPAVQIRSSARPFDTGGIFNFNVLVRDIDARFAELQANGFQGFADPNRYVLFGKRYAGALLRGPDGVVINLLQRIDEPYDDQPPFVTISHVTNATQMVADFDRSFDFFTRQLGWSVRWQASPTWPADGSNNMGLPESLLRSGTVRERAASFRIEPQATGGSLEIFAFEGLRGRDYSTRAQPPNLGILAYRIHVPDLAAYERRIRANGVLPLAPTRCLQLPPYGTVEAFVVRSPDGAWLEFFEQRDCAAVATR